jgi:hypothetical protein
MERVLNAPVSTPKDFDRRNEVAFRGYIEDELANKYDKRSHLIIPSSFYLGFNGVTGKQVVLGLNGSDQFTISIDGNTAIALATDSSVSSVSAEVVAARQGEANLSAKVTQMSAATATVDGKLSASYGLTVDVNGRIASMKLLSNGTTSSVKFLATTFSIYDGTSDVATFEVSGGNVYVAGSKVRTESMAVNAVTNATYEETATAMGPTTSWTTIADVSVTTPDANTYQKIDWSFFGSVDGNPLFDTEGGQLEVRILRNSTEIYSTVSHIAYPAVALYIDGDGQYYLFSGAANHAAGFDLDAPGAANSYTYELQVKKEDYGSGALSWSVSDRRLFVQMFKR